MPKGRKHSPEEIIKKLRQAEVDLGSGQTVAQVCQKLEISEQTYHRWKAQYGGMKTDELKRLKELEAENLKLKRLVADQALDILALKEIAQGKWQARPRSAVLPSI